MPSQGIQDISPLKYAANLAHLDISGNELITDFTPLAGLTQLTHLNLANNGKLSDLTVLQNLTNLEYLDLTRTGIANLSGLQDMLNLTTLKLANNQITNFSPISSLSILQDLDVSSTGLADLTPIQTLTNLVNLNIQNNKGITDLTPLSGLTKLLSLNVASLNITTLNGIQPLIDLQELTANYNYVLTDINALASLTNLEYVYLNSDLQIPQDQDPDGDGASNKQEIAVATNPMDASKHPLFKSEGDILGLKAIVDELKKQITYGYDTLDGWTVATEDFDADGDIDVIVHVHGQSEQWQDLTCWYDCGEDYYGEPRGFLLAFENVNGTYQQIDLENAISRPNGDIAQMLPYDYDNDGLKDILLVFYGQTILLHNQTTTDGPLTFTEVTGAVGLPTSGGGNAAVIDINRDGYLDLIHNRALWQYSSDTGTYIDVTAATGLNNLNYLYTTLDINNDGLLDIITRNATWFNNGNGTFSEFIVDFALVSTDPLVSYGLHNMVPFDYNNDGKQDIALFETVYRRPNNPYSDFDYSGTRMRVFENTGYFDANLNQFVVQFEQVAEYVNGQSTFTQGGSTGDYNNDGIADLLMTQYGQNKTDLLQGDGSGGFIPVTDRLGFIGVSNKAVIFADYNGDGATDLFMPGGSRGGHSDYLFTNYPNNNHYLHIDLRGQVQRRGNSGTPDAIGARVEVSAGGVTQTKYVQSGLGTTHRLFFGLGAAAAATVTVHWPSGIVSKLSETDIGGVDQILTVEEPLLVFIDDPQLKTAVYETLGLDSTVTLYQQHIDQLTSLDVSNRGITNISGIEAAVNLQTLDLSNNQIQDLGPLALMPNLDRVYLSGNPLDRNIDSDGDGATDGQEIDVATNPMNADSHPLYRTEPDQFGFAALVTELNAEEPALGNLLDGWHAAWEDLDRDGDIDAVVYIHGGDEAAVYSGPTHGKLAVFENVNGVYQRSVMSIGEDRFDGDLRNMLAVDYDNDGQRDLVLGFEHQLALLRNTTAIGNSLQFTNVTTVVGLPEAIDLTDVSVLDTNRDGFIDVLTVAGTQSQLWQFDRAAETFFDATAASGLSAVADFGLTVTVDVDNNGTLDLITHETSGATRGLVTVSNNGDGTFTNIVNSADLSSLAAMDVRSIVPADYDNDGRLDLVIFNNTSPGDQAEQIVLVKNAAPQNLQIDTANNGLSDPGGTSDEVLSGAVGDFNNDGLVDFVRGEINAGRTALFANQGAGQFTKLDNIAGVGNMGNRVPTFADYNNDGQLDLLLPGSVSATSDTTDYYYTNLGTRNHYLALELVGRVQRTGSSSGRDASGAIVQVTANGVTQTQQMIPHFGGTHRLSFGLGDATDAEVLVQWPSGLTSQLTPADIVSQGGIDQILTIEEPSADGSIRVATGLLAYYVFDEGAGSVVHDQSGAAQPLDLTASGAYTWLGSRNGLLLSNATMQNSIASRLNERLSTSGPFTFELWFKPADIVQGGPAQIASYYGEMNSHRLSIGQEGVVLEGTTRTAAGTTLATKVTTDLTTDIHHVALTYDGYQLAWYHNGVLADVNEEITMLPDALVSSQLLLGNNAAGDSPWAGELYQVAIYSRALSDAEINRNYRDGTDPLNTDEDGDSVPDAMDALPLDPNETIDSDNDGIGDNADTDDDNDGILDVNDAAPLDSSQFMTGSYADAAHVLNRITFGATPELVNEVAQIGIDAYIQQQLDPLTLQEDPSFQPMDEAAVDNLSKLRYYTMYHMQYSRKQLREVMTQFWDNHFSTNYSKHNQTVFELREQQQFRQYALGRFRDLLEISAKSPAMLAYLDNYISKQPEANENYARELLELHTLGVGNYTQKDIVALAKIFTGWSIDVYNSKIADNPIEGQFVFNSADHSQGEKILFDGTIYKTVINEPLNPIREGELALDAIANHPATASFICKKLVQLFVADEFVIGDSSSAAGRIHTSCVNTFRYSNGDIQAVLTTILTAPDFLNSNHREKVKSPLEFATTAVRNFATDPSANYAVDLNRAMAYMGMPLFQNGPPEGFPETGDEWTNSNMLMQRIRAGNEIAFETTNTKLDVIGLVSNNGLRTAREVVSFLFTLAYGGEYTELEYSQALELLNPAGEPPFHITLPDAELRLRRLLGTMMSYPDFQYQ
jgi:uncharacterized protein (DUF1800 family)/Leucine-rich repeat (LRR) protein